jgi:hypothetical protein
MTSSGVTIKVDENLRRRYGEQITGKSYVMRKLFRVSHVKRADDPNATTRVVTLVVAHNNEEEDDTALQKTRGRATDIDAAHPTKMDQDSISSLLARAMYETGIRPTLEEGKTRHEIKSAHFQPRIFQDKSTAIHEWTKRRKPLRSQSRFGSKLLASYRDRIVSRLPKSSTTSFDKRR